MRDWTAYLDSVCKEYAQWWDNFTVTDVEAEAIALPRSPSEREKKVERLGVLAGLRKYAKERVLLTGVPGSGKSTALKRLVLEVAQEVKEGKSDRIPVLVELRDAKPSIFKRIVKEIKKRDRRSKINEEVLEEEWLYEEKFLLLFDGLNELPSDDVTAQLQNIERDYPDVWMVFTSRNLGNGGIVNVDKQLIMQPLTEEQMRIFVRKQNQGEQILQQLGSRLRELGKTPMFLWMLCKTVGVEGDVPRNAGELLRQFVQYEYEQGLKKEILAGELRDCWQDLLEELAFAMMPRKEQINIHLVMSRKDAEEILEKFLERKGGSDRFCRVKKYLKGLLKHHLLQIRSEDKLEFHHQLIQEYYAAMRLKRMVSGLTDEVLQRDYLNLFEWTEAIALMLGLLEDEEQAVRVVRSALAVDWQLGARLAGEVKREFQGKTVALVSDWDVPLKVKYELWGMTRSDGVVDCLIPALQDEDFNVRWRVVEVLERIGTKVAEQALISTFRDESFLVRCRKLSRRALNNEIDMRWRMLKALGKMGSKEAEENLISALQHEKSEIRRRAETILKSMDTDAAKEALISTIQDKSDGINWDALKAYQDMIDMRWKEIEALGEISTEKEALISALQDENLDVRYRVVEAMEKLGLEAETSLISALQDECFFVGGKAVEALEKIGSEAAIEALVSTLQDKDSKIRGAAAEALGMGNIDSDIAGETLISALQDEDSEVRWIAAQALGKMGSEAGVKVLISDLQDEDLFVCTRAATALGNIAQPTHIPQLLNILQNTQNLELLTTIAAIQARAKYYNHALTLPTPTPDPQERATLEDILLLLNQTLKTMSESPKYQVNTQNFQVVEKGHGGHHTHNYAPTQDLKEAAAEIQQLLQQLKQENPTATEAEILQEAIQSNPTFKDRLLNALKRGGSEALNIVFPVFSIARETVLGFLQNNPDREVRQITTNAIAQLQEQNPDNEE